MKRARLVLPAAALCAGIGADHFGFGVAATALSLALACVASARRSPMWTMCAVAVALGAVDAICFARGVSLHDETRTRRHRAVVIERLPRANIVTTNESGVLARLDDGRVVSAYLRVDPSEQTTCGDSRNGALPIGERVVVRGRVLALDEARNPGEPSEREIARERGIDARLAHASLLRCDGVDTGDPRLWLARLRDAASQRVHERLPEPDASILAGALWGERGSLPRELRDEFQETGTVHVLVTAGLHLGVVAWIGATLLRALGVGRIASSLATIALVWSYAAFSGAHLPSMRAATMLSFVLLARASGREAYLPNALAAAAIVVALARPSSVVSISFALSFSCVAAIVLFAGPIARWLERRGAPAFASEALALSCATQFGTWPLTASAFLTIAPYAPLANVLVVPVIGVAMLVGGAELLASPLPALANAFANIERTLLDWIVSVVRITAHLPGADIRTPPPAAWTIALYDGALLAFAWLSSRGAARRGALLVAAATVLCVWQPSIPHRDLVVTAIDVGQADALLIQTPNGHAFLVDAGGRLERGPATAGDSAAEAIGERTVVPFLLRCGVRRLDTILLSHPHGDHAGGVAPVLRTLAVGGFADSGQNYPGHAYHDALDVATLEQVPMLEPRAGSDWRTDDGVTFRFYGPLQPYLSGTRSDINTNSLVFRLEYRNFRMLFTGDAGAEMEAAMLARHDDLRADVLKVGHHGSAYGTTPKFVRAVAPRDAIVSVGRDNLFGHPAPQTLATLRSFGIAVYRTDRDGAVTIESDGERFTVAPFLSSPPARANLANRRAAGA